MNRVSFAVCLVISLFVATSARASSEDVTSVPIVVGAGATSVERVAAQELASALTKLYSKAEFGVTESERVDGMAIYVGTAASSPWLSAHTVRDDDSIFGWPGSNEVSPRNGATGGSLRSTPATQTVSLSSDKAPVNRRPQGREGYVVTTAKVGGHDCGLVVGSDPAGVMYGVHGLLRHLGVGCFLNGDTLPQPTTEPFSFSGWNLSDRPLVPTRIVFNWHNFLSGCSTWDVEQWQQWITQSQKMGYNAVMVHAYGNNPMAGFEFEGVQKPVGYLSSTRVGRDWSTNHVNDVRRLFGGSVFKTPVFGCVAAVEGTDLQRTEAAQSLMAKAFAVAEQRGVDVYFAVDIDTTSANPQELIRLLPEHARFEIDVPKMEWMGQEAGKAWLANPDTKEGYEFYKAQVEHLLRVYPQIDCLVAWHRTGGTPWMAFSQESMPQPWQKQYEAEVSRTPEAAKLWHSHHMFAQAKIVRAFRRALDELGRADIRLAFGSWRVTFLPSADRFLPRDVPLIPLDALVLKDQSIFDTAERRGGVAETASGRPVIPIAWAHHDDGNYVGRPYTPYSVFYDRLAEMKCTEAGFGIIHWTTKPLDLYFRSLVNQVWQSSKNEPLEATCQRMARQLIGREQAEPFAAYLKAWVTTMPKIGRETSDFFIDHELKDLASVEAAHRRRLKMLGDIDRTRLSSTGSEWIDYFTGLEHFILDIYRTENAFNRAKKQFLAGDLESARSTMGICQPEKVIEHFAEFSQKGGLTRGEEGLVVTLNTRWLPHYVRFRQMLGLDSVRYNFAPTSHDPLAQMRGVFTFHFDSRGDVWQCLGAEETAATVFRCPAVCSRSSSRNVFDKSNSPSRVAGGADARASGEGQCPLSGPDGPTLPEGRVNPKTRFESRDEGGWGRTKSSPSVSHWGLAALDPSHTSFGRATKENVPVAKLAKSFGGPPKVLATSATVDMKSSATCLRTASLEQSSVETDGEVDLIRKEICQTGIETEQPITLPIRPIITKGDRGKLKPECLPAGNYELTLLCVDPTESSAGDNVFNIDISITDSGKDSQESAHPVKSTPRTTLASDRIDIRKAAGGSNRVCLLSYNVGLTSASALELTLTPVRGKARICGAVLTPVTRPK